MLSRFMDYEKIKNGVDIELYRDEQEVHRRIDFYGVMYVWNRDII